VRPLLWFNALLLGLLVSWYAFQPAARRAEVDQLIENYLEREKGIDLLDLAWDLHQLYASGDFVRAPGRASDGGYLYAGLPRARWISPCGPAAGESRLHGRLQ
jgi:hypothetical protein